MNEVALSKSFSDSVSEIRGKSFTGKLKIPSLRKLWSILKTGGEIEFEVESSGWDMFDHLAANEIQKKEEDEMKKKEKDMKSKTDNISRRL